MHRYIETAFRPQTGLVTFSTMDHDKVGMRKRKSKDSGATEELNEAPRSRSVHVPTCWIAMDGIKRGKDDSIQLLEPPFKERCCSVCVPSLYTFQHDVPGTQASPSQATPSRTIPNDPSWIVSPRKHRARAGSQGSIATAVTGSGRSSRASNQSVPLPRLRAFYHVDAQAVDTFRTLLWTWRDKEFSQRTDDEFFLTKADILSIRTHSMVVGEARRWLSMPESITPATIRECVQWDLADDDFLERLAGVIREWVEDVKAKQANRSMINNSPRKGEKRKQPRIENSPNPVRVKAKTTRTAPAKPAFATASTSGSARTALAPLQADVFGPIPTTPSDRNRLLNQKISPQSTQNSGEMYPTPNVRAHGDTAGLHYPTPTATPQQTITANPVSDANWIPTGLYHAPSSALTPPPTQAARHLLSTSSHQQTRMPQLAHRQTSTTTPTNGTLWATPPASQRSYVPRRSTNLSQSQGPTNDVESDSGSSIESYCVEY
jgi:hypothetical protein